MNNWRFIATFSPKRTDDLTPRAREFVGWRGEWVYAGMAPDDHYGGQETFQPNYVAHPGLTPPFAWVPAEDLADAEEVHALH